MAEYNIYKNFGISANIYGDQLKDVPTGLITFFNTPKTRYNLGLSNANLYKGFGFNINYKWVQGFMYEGSPQFTGFVDTYDLVDAQMSYNVKKINTTLPSLAQKELSKTASATAATSASSAHTASPALVRRRLKAVVRTERIIIAMAQPPDRQP